MLQSAIANNHSNVVNGTSHTLVQTTQASDNNIQPIQIVTTRPPLEEISQHLHQYLEALVDPVGIQTQYFWQAGKWAIGIAVRSGHTIQSRWISGHKKTYRLMAHSRGFEFSSTFGSGPFTAFKATLAVYLIRTSQPFWLGLAIRSNLNISRIVSHNAVAFEAARQGTVYELRKQLQSKQASIFDITLGGESLLHVSDRYLPSGVSSILLWIRLRYEAVSKISSQCFY